MAKSGSGLTRKKIQKRQYFSSVERKDEKGEQNKHSDSHSVAREQHGTHAGKARNPIQTIYEDHYKGLMLIPLFIFVIALSIIGFTVATTGNMMDLGVSITGGISMTIPDVGDFDPVEVEEEILSRHPDADLTVRRLVSQESIGVSIEASGIEGDDMHPLMRDVFGEFSDYSLEETGSSLGEAFFRQSLIALVFAFALMGGVVFLSFRVFVPSVAVMLSAFFDIVVTVAIVNILGITVSTAGLVAFLMLIGYSVDTDILMSSKMLKGSFRDTLKNLYSAMRTGLMMEATTVAVLVVGIVFSNSDVLIQIMTIVLIGILVDLLSTWIQNSGMLRWYLERQENTSHSSR
ncbi:MAG: protein translocase subunit SecF [Candidatus Woesearchaeota archaeon]